MLSFDGEPFTLSGVSICPIWILYFRTRRYVNRLHSATSTFYLQALGYQKLTRCPAARNGFRLEPLLPQRSRLCSIRVNGFRRVYQWSLSNLDAAVTNQLLTGSACRHSPLTDTKYNAAHAVNSSNGVRTRGFTQGLIQGTR